MVGKHVLIFAIVRWQFAKLLLTVQEAAQASPEDAEPVSSSSCMAVAKMGTLTQWEVQGRIRTTQTAGKLGALI